MNKFSHCGKRSDRADLNDVWGVYCQKYRVCSRTFLVESSKRAVHDILSQIPYFRNLWKKANIEAANQN